MAASSVSGYQATVKRDEPALIAQPFTTRAARYTTLALAHIGIIAVFHKEEYERIKAVFYQGSARRNPMYLKESMEKLIIYFQSNEVPTDGLHPERILESLCPNQEFDHQLMAHGNWQSPLAYHVATQSFTALYTGVMAPTCEEIVFRRGLQEIVLKDGVREVIKRISPAHANLVDSRIYTVCRIIITSIVFASVHYYNTKWSADEGVQDQVCFAFLGGLLLGALKETDSLSVCIYAHMINNLVVQLSTFCMKC